MNESTKNSIRFALQLLKHTLTSDGVSIATTKDKELYFFDTNTYLETGEFDGIKVNMDDLVL